MEYGRIVDDVDKAPPFFAFPRRSTASLDKGTRMRRGIKYTLALIAAFICLVVGLWEYSSYRGQKDFSAAKNKCEVGCVQDSGGLEECRKFCAQHPDHYP